MSVDWDYSALFSQVFLNLSLPLKGSKFEKVHCLIVRDKIIVLDLALLKKELEEKQTEISDLKEDLRIVRQGEYTNLSVRPFFIKKKTLKFSIWF